MERRKLLSRLGIAVLVFAAIWTAVILRWRMTNRVPNGVDVGLYLIALPLGLLLLAWLGFKIAGRIKKRKQAREAGAAAGAGDDPTTATNDPSLTWQLPLIAVDALLPAGATLDTVIDAAREGIRAELHASLRDASQRPAFAAEVDGVDIDALDDTLPETAKGWPEARKRALALGEMLATQMLDEHFDTLRPTPDPKAPMTRAKPPVAQLEWLLPSAWSDADRDLAADWLRQRLAEQGWDAPELRVQAGVAEAGAPVLKRLDDLNRAFHENTLALPHLLLASDSHLDAATVAEWDAAHRLHGAANAEGRVPGEGAAALLVAPSTHAAEPLPVRLGRLYAARRAKAVEQPQRLQADTLEELAGKVTAPLAGGSDDDNGGDSGELTLVADTDMRASRTAEALHFTETLLPEQDPEQSLLGIGTANGCAGAALTLAVVAAAVHAGSTDGQPCLVFSHQDPALRAAMLVAPPPAATADSTT